MLSNCGRFGCRPDPAGEWLDPCQPGSRRGDLLLYSGEVAGGRDLLRRPALAGGLKLIPYVLQLLLVVRRLCQRGFECAELGAGLLKFP